VTVNSFLASGGDGFTVLLRGTNLVGGDVDLDALIDHIATLPSDDQGKVSAQGRSRA
jgi:5'-nucleotidase